MSQYKTCTKCLQTKSLDNYFKLKTSKDGLRTACKACAKESSRAWRSKNAEKVAANQKAWREANAERYKASQKAYQAANPEAVTGRARAWREANPEKGKKYRKENAEKLRESTKKWAEKNRERRRETNRAWKQANKQRITQAQREYYLENREKILIFHKDYRDSNREKRKHWANFRRAKQIGNGAFRVTAKEIAKLRSQPCAYCGKPSEHIDHIIPISRGGTHSIGNLTGACASCNLSKSSRFIMEWKKGETTNER